MDHKVVVKDFRAKGVTRKKGREDDREDSHQGKFDLPCFCYFSLLGREDRYGRDDYGQNREEYRRKKYGRDYDDRYNEKYEGSLILFV